jgi:tetratricopeptide (TPR) repeat protein
VKVRRIAAIAFALISHFSFAGAPYVPVSDTEILERLPSASGPAQSKELRALRERQSKQPQDLRLALELAGRYVQLGRASGDPRYAGYAQAVLSPWWESPEPPVEVLAIRATLRQRQHQFAAALADLGTILAQRPGHAQARLTRATVLQVQGRFQEAARECATLQPLVQELIWAQCAANVQAATGGLGASYSGLLAVLGGHPEADSLTRAWVLTTLAELAARQGLSQAAEQHFRTALALDPTDQYLLASFADFLLDRGRPREAMDLVRAYTRADPLLLRYALAAQALGAKDLNAIVDEMSGRFEASLRRGDRVHLREEARFVLQLKNDARAALQLALANWEIQKEAADARILLEAARAAKADAQVARIGEWLRRWNMEDVTLKRLASAASSTSVSTAAAYR